MSEYQYYEFLAVDRPLTEREMGALRSISSRAEITPTHFSNEYSYGDLKAEPGKLLDRYFDVHVYLANWGTRRLAMRLPREALPLDGVASYCVGDGARTWRAGEHIVIDLWSETEDYEGWVEGRGWMASLAGARSALLHGDGRPLYLAWLLCVERGEVDDDDEEPPVPPGLGSLPSSLQAMAAFLRIDEHLVAAAAESSGLEEAEPVGLAEWIFNLPTDEKDALLLRAAQGEHAHVAATLIHQFKIETRQAASDTEQARRTVGELCGRADELREAHAREQAGEAAEARRRREAATAAARTKRLAALAARKSEAWRDVERLVASKKPKSYDEAVTILADLRDLAAGEGEEQGFTMRLGDIRERYARKSSFIARLDKAVFRRGHHEQGRMARGDRGATRGDPHRCLR